MSEGQERPICQQCGEPVHVEVEFGSGWESPVKLYFECTGCNQSGWLEDPDYAKPSGVLG